MKKIIGIIGKDNKFYFKFDTYSVNSYLFDGKTAQTTQESYWFMVDSIFEKIVEVLPKKQINKRFELKNDYPESDKTPKIVQYEQFYDEDGDSLYPLNWYDIKYEEEEQEPQNIEFEIIIIDENRDFEIIKSDFEIETSFLNKLRYPKILNYFKDCYISSENLYRYLRNYIKQNINLEYAEITSDYDFCFTVNKRVFLLEPEAYQIDTNQRWGSRRRRPKYETRYRKDRKVVVFEMAPKPYNSYSVIEPIAASNYKELKEKIDMMCKDLIESINKPLKECSHCEGTGVIEVERKGGQNE